MHPKENHSQRKINRAASIYYTNQKSCKKQSDQSLGRSNLSSSVRTGGSKKSSLLAPKKKIKLRNPESERVILDVQKKKLYHMKGRRVVGRQGKPQSCSVTRKKSARVRRNEPKPADTRRTTSKRGAARGSKGVVGRQLKKGVSERKTKDKERAREQERTKELIERYANPRKISFSQPKSQSESMTKTKRGLGFMNNIRAGRKLYKHTTKTTRKKPVQTGKAKHRGKFTLSVPKKKNADNAKAEEIRKKRKMASLSKKGPNTEKKAKSKKKKGLLNLRGRTSKTEFKNHLKLGQVNKKRAKKLKMNYQSENIYSPNPVAPQKLGGSGIAIETRKTVNKNKEPKKASPSFSREYIESIRKYNQSMEQYRSNMVRNKFHIRSEQFSQSSNKSGRAQLFLRNRKQKLSPFRFNQAQFLNGQIQKSYSNMLYEKKAQAGAEPGDQDNRNYNSLYSDTRFILNQKRSKSSNLSQNATADNVMLLDGFDPVRYLALKQEVRGKSLNSTAKTLNIKLDSQKVRSTRVGLDGTLGHNSLPPASNMIIQRASSRPGGIRVYKLGEELLQDPEAKKLVQGKKIYSLGKHKYIRLDSCKKVVEWAG